MEYLGSDNTNMHRFEEPRISQTVAGDSTSGSDLSPYRYGLGHAFHEQRLVKPSVRFERANCVINQNLMGH